VTPKATIKELRSFGLVVGSVFALIGIWPILFRGESWHLWAVVVGGLLIICGGLVPAVLAPVHKGWMWVGHVLGWINTRILLGIVYFGLITPMGIFFRLMGKDTMQQAFNDSNATYRVVRQPRPSTHMRNQF